MIDFPKKNGKLNSRIEPENNLGIYYYTFKEKLGDK